MNNSQPNPPTQARSGLPWAAVGAIVVFVVVGFALLAFAIYSLSGEPDAPQATQVVVAPTQTSPVFTAGLKAPTPVFAPTLPPTWTAIANPTQPPATATETHTPEPLFTIVQPANVRSGPGTNYPVLGGLQPGASATVVGRDASGQWYVISFAGSRSGQGWVSALVATYRGDVQSLPVIAAPPTPVPTNTPLPSPTLPPPPTSTPSSAHGLTGQLTLCDPGKTAYAVSERICFVERIVNPTSSTVHYGILGVQAANLSGGTSQFQTSWSGDLAINSGCIGPTDRCGGPWEDGIRINTPGTYRLTLQICYSTVDVCPTSNSEWEVLSAGITVSVN